MPDQEITFKHFHSDGADYFKLHMMCPACLENNIPNNKHTDWLHDTKADGTPCGGDMYIGDNGYYCCEKCLYKSPIVGWQYKCPKHEEYGLNTYLSVTKGKFIGKAISVAGQLTGKAGLVWLNKLTAELIKQFPE